MNRNLVSLGIVAACALALSACGSRSNDRVASGTGVGAGTGALVGAAFGGIGAIPGALIGAGIGAGTGAVTDKDQLYLGEPVWR
ncbi:YMGG-like glycine zipper-containing protein [Stella sp.]|uniref:YMGG-like glycine zipper-containing protein n=1 Tax=Stella sp. TaxID=2912054 RepID=UPI0035AFA8CB